ncbi:hypothetical protein CLOP_g20881 [Closterium sp. NIES-67]|nr:hypothetical protein CLOP_g20881 [Closterium sp. NIES-67]
MAGSFDDPDLAVEDYIPKDKEDMQLMRERWSKLLLGDDPSGGAKGCGPALAMANAITSVSASIFGDGLRLRPLPEEDERKWRREMGIMVSVCRHIVELAPAWTTRPDGSRFEVMRRSVRADLRIQLPALSQLDTMLLTILQHSQSDEYYYEDELPGGDLTQEDGEEEEDEEEEDETERGDDDVDDDDDDDDRESFGEGSIGGSSSGMGGMGGMGGSAGDLYGAADKPFRRSATAPSERPATSAGPYGSGGTGGRLGGGGDGGDRGRGGGRGGSHGHGSGHNSVHGSSTRGSSTRGSSAHGSSADEEEFVDDEARFSQAGEFDGVEQQQHRLGLGSSPGYCAERRGSEEDFQQQQMQMQQQRGGGGGEGEDACSSGSNTGSNAGSATGSRGGSSPNPGSSWGFHQRSSSAATPAAAAGTAASGSTGAGGYAGGSSGAPSGVSSGGSPASGKRRVSSRSSSFSYDFSALLGGGRSRGGSITAAAAAAAGVGGPGVGGGIPSGGGGASGGLMRGLKRSVTDVRDKRITPEAMGGPHDGGGMGGGEDGGGGNQVWRWRMKPRVRGALGEALVRWLEQQMEKTSQIMKLAMTINQQVLQDMEVPEAFVQRLPKNVRAVVGDRVYAALHANPFTDDKLLSTVDLSNQKAALKLACKLEAAEQIWMRQLLLARDPQLSHTFTSSSRDAVRLEESLQRVSSCLAAIRRRWPDLPQTTLDLAKIAFNGDIGKAVLESYSRVLEGAASNIRSRIRDVLHANYLFLNPQQFMDLPCDPHPQGLRHPTFSVLMPETVFDAVSLSSDNSESTNGSVRSFDSSRSGGSTRSGKGARGGGVGGGGGGGGGGDGAAGLGAAVGPGYPSSGVLGKASAKWDMRPPRSPELRSPLIAGAGGGVGVGGGAGVSGGGGAGVYPSSGSGGGGSGGSSPSASPSRPVQRDRFLRRTGSLQPTGRRGNRSFGRSQSGGMADEVMMGMDGMGGGGGMMMSGGGGMMMGGGGGGAGGGGGGGGGGGRGGGSPGYQVSPSRGPVQFSPGAGLPPQPPARTRSASADWS